MQYIHHLNSEFVEGTHMEWPPTSRRQFLCKVLFSSGTGPDGRGPWPTSQDGVQWVKENSSQIRPTSHTPALQNVLERQQHAQKVQGVYADRSPTVSENSLIRHHLYMSLQSLQNGCASYMGGLHGDG